ncbi:MAG TPA: carboxymuconolactone decarboxylase family protein [Candidatus Latescibacteria bacterium]|nr:carboxymuconolactone decarboxylase family protein [Candidatus Latescibacterota bacterium]MDP7364461.1 carboxymuconolactone decarboxylase family protein [Candidatus Latescibacterota bacterium]HJN31027.1 carboxymuconolactone decarboxylase family protein [Candidatus Latescibacterota bacterium]
MSEPTRPPKMYQRFVEQYPKLGQAWDLIADQGADGPIDERTQRLIKLGIAMGAMRTGAVHSGVRKALALGITEEELEQVVALAAGTLGMPSTVANYSWVRDVLDAEGD